MNSRGLVVVILVTLAFSVMLDSVYETAYRMVVGKASYSREAVFAIDGTSKVLSLDRRATHVFLAEYERTLVFCDRGEEIFRFAAAGTAEDLSRMNVYQIDKFNLYLAGDHSSDRYIVNTLGPAISREILGEMPTGAKFVGAFDRDEHGWRFISVSERAEIPIAFSQIKRIDRPTWSN